jgi:molybdopterin molybdotransferase
VALAGALGLRQLTVFRQLRVGLFSTGDELCEPGDIRRSGQIWDANRLLLPGLLAPLACEVHDYGILQDDALNMEGALLTAARDCDLLITTGGMSVGTEDHIRSIIGRRGSLEVWPLAIKPGRPVGLGDIDDCPILALPGNPIAAAIAFIAFGRPIITTLSGARDEQPLTLDLPAGFAFEKRKGIRQFLLADLARSADGTSIVIPWPQQSPAMLSSLAGARGIIVLPEDRTHVAPGDPVAFVPLDTLLQ